MQDIQSIGGGAGGGRLFSGSVDRRLRPHHHHHQGHAPPALKCPRCESLNTKFCYYNNYNLSQPRHFCKSCRRYWTKGGVLRNVPVGGGCRKTKRPKSKSGNTTETVRKSSNSQNSSSDSSSLTATTTAANTPATATGNVPVTASEVLSGINSSNSAPTLLNFHETSTRLFTNPSFDPMENNTLFSEIGTFTSLIASSTSQLPITFNESPFRLHHTGQNQILTNSNSNQQWMQTDNTIGDDLKMQETTGTLGFMDQTMQNKPTDGGLNDWNEGADQALFDLTGTVDDQSYWNQTQWDDHGDNDRDHQLDYLR